ncbi:MAG: hypothetical protein ACKOCV_01530 [Gemmatimonadota bacterium]
MRRGARWAAVAFILTWVPLTLWRGLAFGAAFRIGDAGARAWSPLAEGVLQIGMVMLVPALLVALLTFVLWAWREERRG